MARTISPYANPHTSPRTLSRVLPSLTRKIACLGVNRLSRYCPACFTVAYASPWLHVTKMARLGTSISGHCGNKIRAIVWLANIVHNAERLWNRDKQLGLMSAGCEWAELTYVLLVSEVQTERISWHLGLLLAYTAAASFVFTGSC